MFTFELFLRLFLGKKFSVSRTDIIPLKVMNFWIRKLSCHTYFLTETHKFFSFFTASSFYFSLVYRFFRHSDCVAWQLQHSPVSILHIFLIIVIFFVGLVVCRNAKKSFVGKFHLKSFVCRWKANENPKENLHSCKKSKIQIFFFI